MAGDVSIGPFVVGETVVTSVISFLLPSYHRSLSHYFPLCITSVCRPFRQVIIAGEVIALHTRRQRLSAYLICLRFAHSELIVVYRHGHTTCLF